MTSPEELARLLSREHLLKSLENATGRNDAQICGEVEVKRATEGIEGFTSVVLRVKIPYRFNGEETSTHLLMLVVKCLPQVETQIELVKKTRVFLREGVYFDKVAPLVMDISKGVIELPIPACYATLYGGDNDAIYMEDLSQRGFRTPDFRYRLDGLDLAHCIISMKRLGRLHGLLVAAEKALPGGKGSWTEMFPTLSKDAIFYEPMPGDPPFPLQGMIETGLDTLRSFSKEIDGLPKEAEASGMLEKIIPGIMPTLWRLVKPDSKGRNILTHGDCWMNNIMFRYEKDSSGMEAPVDAKFVDLQLARYCHPSIDILYFMYLGSRKTFRVKHMDQLITVYYDSMTDTLNSLEAGLPPLTLEELLEDLHGTYKPFGVILGVIFTPVIFLGDFVPEKAEDMSPEMFKEFFETGNSSMIRKRFSEDQDYRSAIVENIKEFMDMAFPDGITSLKSSPILISRQNCSS